MNPKQKRSEMIYQLKVTLRGSRPPIWRRLLVPADATLYDLHYIIQVAMGWTNSHLHQYIIQGEYYGIPSEDDWQPIKNEIEYTLADVLTKEKDKIVYEYDFGDGWEHTIMLEHILPKDAKEKYPKCIYGARACPPEDIGGIWGYEEFLAAMSDPTHEEHKDYVDWWGEIFDPEKFDLKAVNDRLKHIDQMKEWDF